MAVPRLLPRPRECSLAREASGEKDICDSRRLLKRFNNNDTTLSNFEVLSLLIGFTDKPEYKPYQDLDTEREIYKLNGEKKYNAGLELGQRFIKTHPLSVKTLFEMAYSFHKNSRSKICKWSMNWC